jgi:bacillithiol biosynthesis cysteine-adding enzyme BshC
MQLKKIAFADTHALSSFFLDYIQQNEKLQTFYNRFPSPQNFQAQIDEKQNQFSQQQRTDLVDTLKKQYHSLSPNAAVTDNITALQKSTTFTVTTGHQLNIFTGPLYFIYKIVTAINTCRQLKKTYPAYDFVPVYWMASEDHDYEEIKSFRLYGKKYTWQTDQQGAVGRFDTTGLKEIASQLPGDAKIFLDAYGKHSLLADAVRHYVNALFEKEGLVVLDADDALLKSSFKKEITDDVLNNANKPLVENTTSSLESLHYKTQVHCRDINFFYLDKNLRSRIEKKGERYHVVDTNLSFSREEISQLIDQHPERFSPNVILRPLYQEVVLPNLAYIGGPAEVIYWLQLKAVFERVGIAFPILMPRNFALVVDPPIARKFEKTELELKDLFEEKNFLFNHWVLKHSPRNITVGEERSVIQDLFTKLGTRADLIDKTLMAFVAAEGKRAINSLEKIERKFIRAEKRLHSDRLRQIEAVKDALFPNGSLQERTDNAMNFTQSYPGFIEALLAQFDPFDFRFNVLLL